MGGFAATAVMTFMMYFVAPMMIGQPMDIAAMLGSTLGDSWALGMMAHAVNGVLIFPLIYVLVLYRFLPGAPWLKGATWGAARPGHRDADDGRRILQLSSGRDDGGDGLLDGSYRVRGDTRWGCRCSHSTVGQVVVSNRTGAFN